MLRGELQCTLRLTEQAKGAVRRMLDDSGTPNATAGILWGKWQDERTEHWSIGLYDRKTAEGWLVRSPDLEFIVIQDFIVERLDGKTLDIDGHQITIT
jgi:hypothetical protein